MPRTTTEKYLLLIKMRQVKTSAARREEYGRIRIPRMEWSQIAAHHVVNGSLDIYFIWVVAGARIAGARWISAEHFPPNQRGAAAAPRRRFIPHNIITPRATRPVTCFVHTQNIAAGPSRSKDSG